MRRQHWSHTPKADTTVGAFCMGSSAYGRNQTTCPTHLSKKDRRAWFQGWNAAAEKHGDDTRLEVPEVKPMAPRKKSPAMGEAGVIQEAVQIASHRGWYVERRNTGAIRTGKYFFRYGSVGAADLIVVVPIRGVPVHIEAEAKRRDGKGKLSESQQDFCRRMEGYQIPYIVFTSGEKFESQIEQICLDLDVVIE